MQTNLGENAFPFEWLDVHNPSEEELRQLANNYSLPPAAVIDCLQSEHLPKFEAFENYFFVIVRFYDNNCKKDSDNIQQLTRKIAIFYNKNFLLSIHRSETIFINATAQKYANSKSVKHPFDIVCKLIKNSLETFEAPMKAIDHEMDIYETKIFLKKRVPDILKSFYLIKRKTSVFKKLNTITKMVIEPLYTSHQKNSFYEDLKDKMLHTETTTDEIFENINNLLNLYISLSSQKTNEVMRILTVFSAFFLPLTFIAGIYGMNFHYMPELDSKYGYPASLLFMALVTILIYSWFKRKNWL
ncbi:MAG: magnesium transporter CorA [Bacteroidia bacterium]|nr:magnesium transporter CorA [Bacteroidia bacterium]MCF8427263.1 magnesium transporter CorA [Bacteroidia bacterium]MCF8445977.1 magnesium transporter CorA [Bacteroidia bacterium]